MGMPEDIAAYLVLNGLGVTTTGTPTIVISKAPATPDQVLILREHGGRAPEHTFGASCSAPAVRYHNLQVIARAATYAAAAALARSAFNLLNNYSGTLSGTRYLHIQADQMPADLGEDENKRKLVVCNYTARIAP